jgi:hypothetical protein
VVIGVGGHRSHHCHLTSKHDIPIPIRRGISLEWYGANWGLPD